MTDRHYKNSAAPNHPYNSNIPVSKSGVIVVDTEKLIKQSTTASSSSSATANSSSGKKSRKKRNKNKTSETTAQPLTTGGTGRGPSMVTLKNPIFQNSQPQQQPIRREAEMTPAEMGGVCPQAAIFKNANGMVTIRSSRLQQSFGPTRMPDLKPVLGPEVGGAFMSPSCNFGENSIGNNRISPFDAQEILSGLPGIEITKVDKHSSNKSEFDQNKKSCHTAEVSIIPTTGNGDKFNFDKDDLHYGIILI